MSINDNNKCSHWHLPITMHTNHKTRSHPIHSQKLICDKALSFACGRGMVNRPQFKTGALFRRGLYSRKYSTLISALKIKYLFYILTLKQLSAAVDVSHTQGSSQLFVNAILHSVIYSSWYINLQLWLPVVMNHPTEGYI